MTNTNLLKGRIIERGLSIKKVSEKLNISTQSLYDKLNNKREFKASEMLILSELLNIKDKDIYFFNGV